ncbi:MarR family winged helix-turn-helix transcriptional regulator [Paramicrobacterium sp. CJ85]|uniref:MarR family winged helix-turn-helix transcriptional regulator n=1 Tax=Paramicrobacterium sp. CJ85 TaxID=3445355 RepID=UPI003F643D7A
MAPTDSSPDELLALESQVCFALAVASRGVIDAYRSELDPLQLTHPQYLVMLALWQHGGSSLKQLSGMLKLEPATLSPMVKRLETIGYVTRARDPHDERVLVVELTERGRALRAEATQVPVAMMAKLQLSEDDVRALRDVTTRLIESVERAESQSAADRHES